MPVRVGQFAERVLVAGTRAGQSPLGHACILALTLPLVRIRGTDVAAARNSSLSSRAGTRLTKHTTERGGGHGTEPDERRARSAPLVGADASLCRILHGDPRRHDRARGAAVDRG